MELTKFPSKSTPGKEYTVHQARDGTIYCDCWVWKKTRACSHAKTVEKNIQILQSNGMINKTTLIQPIQPSGSRFDKLLLTLSYIDEIITNFINKG